MGLVFNLWHGQKRKGRERIVHTLDSAGNPKPGSEHKIGPKRAIILSRLDMNGESVMYRADQLGNVLVEHPKHIVDFMGLGWPLVENPGPNQTLIWHERDELSDPYFRKITSELMRLEERGVTV